MKIVISRQYMVVSWILIFVFSLSTIYYLLSTPALAQETPYVTPTPYDLLEPLPLGPNNSEVPTVTTATYLPGLFRLIIGIAGVLAVVRIIWGGIQYMSTDAFSGTNEAKNTIQNAIWGLLLAMAAWLIVYTINPNLVSFNLNIPAQQITTTTIPRDINLPDTGTGLSQQEAEMQLRAALIGIATPVLQGIKQETISEVINLKNSCGCDITVTSATGGTHNPGEYSHGNGWKIDLRLTESLTNYITRNYTKLANRSDGAQMYRAPNGNLYALEDDHWDIQVR